MGRVDYKKDLIKDVKIIDAKFSPANRPLLPQQVCLIKVEALKENLNNMCKNCRFCGPSEFSRLAIELGANGYMHNKEDGLEPLALNPRTGLNLRDPRTKIILKGSRWICHSAEAGAHGIYLVGKNIPPCQKKWQMPKENEEVKK